MEQNVLLQGPVFPTANDLQKRIEILLTDQFVVFHMIQKTSKSMLLALRKAGLLKPLHRLLGLYNSRQIVWT